MPRKKKPNLSKSLINYNTGNNCFCIIKNIHLQVTKPTKLLKKQDTFGNKSVKLVKICASILFTIKKEGVRKNLLKQDYLIYSLNLNMFYFIML